MGGTLDIGTARRMLYHIDWNIKRTILGVMRCIMMLDSVSYAAYLEGRGNGTITDTERDLIQIIQDQEIVTYASVKHSYTFDIMDLVEE